MKKVILIFIICVSFINSYALTYEGCDSSDVSRMKSIIKNINISYDYTIIDDRPYFDITINNLTNDIYFYDNITKKNYYYSDTNNGEITISGYTGDSGKYIFYSNNQSCYGLSLSTKYYIFPQYNRFHTHELCSDIPNFSLCQKWTDFDYTIQQFEEKVLEYKNLKEEIIDEKIDVVYEKTILDTIIQIYINYYYYFFGAIILICSIIIIINNRRNKFKL